jgi:hypothetical protein
LEAWQNACLNIAAFRIPYSVLKRSISEDAIQHVQIMMLASITWLSIIHCCAALQAFVGDEQTPPIQEVAYPEFTFSRYWKVIGPFQIGTRGNTILYSRT